MKGKFESTRADDLIHSGKILRNKEKTVYAGRAKGGGGLQIKSINHVSRTRVNEVSGS